MDLFLSTFSIGKVNEIFSHAQKRKKNNRKETRIAELEKPRNSHTVHACPYLLFIYLCKTYLINTNVGVSEQTGNIKSVKHFIRKKEDSLETPVGSCYFQVKVKKLSILEPSPFVRR